MPDPLQSPTDIFGFDPEKVGNLLHEESIGTLEQPGHERVKALIGKLRTMGAIPPALPKMGGPMQLGAGPVRPGAPPSNPWLSLPYGAEQQQIFDPPKPKPFLEGAGPELVRGAAVAVPSYVGGMVGSRFGPGVARFGAAAGAGLGQGGVEAYDALTGHPSGHAVRNIATAAGIAGILPAPPTSRDLNVSNQNWTAGKLDPTGTVKPGPQNWATLRSKRGAMEAPLKQEYDQLLSSPLGDVEVEPARVTSANASGTNFTMADAKTFKAAHGEQSELGEQATAASRSGDRAGARQLAQQRQQLQQEMFDAARKAGYDPAPYQDVSQRWRDVQNTYRGWEVGKTVLDKATSASGEVNGTSLLRSIQKYAKAGKPLPNQDALLQASQVLAERQKEFSGIPLLHSKINFVLKMLFSGSSPIDLAHEIDGIARTSTSGAAFANALTTGVASSLIPAPPPTPKR